MSDFRLTSKTALAGAAYDGASAQLREIDEIALVSIAIPLGEEETFADTLMSAYGVEVPGSGRSTLAADRTRFLGLQPDQIFALFPYAGDKADAVVADRLGPAAYYTDQSDSWTVLALSGPACLAVLERLCPLDLAPDAFPTGAVTRTVMEHLAVILLRTGVDDFTLLSPRSSANTFMATAVAAAKAIA